MARGRWLAIAIVMFAMEARADFDPIGADGWPKETSVASLRALPRCEGPLRGEPGAEIRCRPPIAEGGAPIAYSTDWTTGLAFGGGGSGGSHAWGHELLVAVTRSWQLGGRYELIGTGTADDRMATTTIGHNLFASARYRWFGDEVTRSAWVVGAGVGWAARASGGAPIARLAIGHDFGTFVTTKSALTSGLELAYERSFDDVSQQHVVGSFKLGFELGIREPRNLGDAPPRSRAPSLRVGFLGMPGVSLGLDAAVGVRRGRFGLETSLGFLFGMSEDRKLTGFEGGQWSVASGPRVHWWHVAYAQAQLGAAWVASTEGAKVQALWHGELGITLGCVETGVWMRRDFEGERTSGGLLFRVGRANGPSFCGGRSSEPRFAVEQLPPPPPRIEPPEEDPPPPVVTPEPPVVVVVPPPPPVVVRVAPVVIEIEVALVWVGRTVAIRIDPRSLPIARLRGARVAIELVGPPQLLGSVEAQLRGLLGGAGVRVDAVARVATPSAGVRVRFTIVP
jgi:hypothetical protein